MHHPQFTSSKSFGFSSRGTIGDALKELDWAVKQVVYTLLEENVYKNTLIWFTSDNG